MPVAYSTRLRRRRQHDTLLAAAQLAALVHGIVDIVAASALFIAPDVLTSFAPEHPEASFSVLASRVIAAALFAIGVMSARHYTAAALRAHAALLDFKIVWSLFAWTGALLSVLQWSDAGVTSPHASAWLTFGVFFAGFSLWVTLRLLVARRLNA